jgi:hypothetical protein
LQSAAVDTLLRNAGEDAGRYLSLMTLDGAGGPSSAFSELASDGAEHRAEIGADEGEGGDGSDCDQCGDQSIFDGRNPGLVPDQIGKNGAQADSPQAEKSNRAQIAPECLNIGKSMSKKRPKIPIP